jgi:L-amino acid N-acyltransferase YncA
MAAASQPVPASAHPAPIAGAGRLCDDRAMATAGDRAGTSADERVGADGTRDVRVRPLLPGHWPQVERIYAAGIATGHATFEAVTPAWEDFDRGKLRAHRYVAVDAAGDVLGWVAASSVSGRCVYAGVVEGSVYVAAGASGRGVGRALLDALTDSTEAAGIWTITAGIFPENVASLALHRAAGYRTVGTRYGLGRMTFGPLAGTWRDVLLLERRSTVAGT